MWPSLNIMYNVAIPKYYHKKVVSLNTNVAILKIISQEGGFL